MNEPITRHEIFVVCPPGLEDALAAELLTLGMAPPFRIEPGGVGVRGPWKLVLRLNLWSRVASRVLVRFGTFGATGLSELRRRTGKLPWTGVLRQGIPLRVRVTSMKSRIYHSGAAEERVTAGISDRLGGVLPPSDNAAGDPEATTVLVRIKRDRVTVSLDTSGEHLHRRGYRLEATKAPLRENIAAGFLRVAGYDPKLPLIDPLCGSGTFAIEAAMMAADRAPGLDRKFSMETWLALEAEEIEAQRMAAFERFEAGSKVEHPPILASDRDAGAVEAAQRNVDRAGVGHLVTVTRQAFSAVRPPAPQGLLITNPPYGARVGKPDSVRDLYASMGHLARKHFSGWSVAMVGAEAPLVGETRLPLTSATPWVDHGGKKIRLFTTS